MVGRMVFNFIIFCISCFQLGSCISNKELAVQFYNEGVEYSRQQRNEEALASYARSISYDDTLAETHQNIAILYENKLQIQNAVHHSLMSIEWARDPIFFGGALSNIVTLLDREQLFDKNIVLTERVLTFFNRAFELDYNNLQMAELLYHLGVVYKSIGNFTAAANYYERVLMLNPAHILALFGYGNILFFGRNYTGASHYYLRCLHAMPEDDYINRMQILNNLGMIHRETGDLQLSLDYFQLAYETPSSVMSSLDNSGILLRNWTLTNVFTVMSLLCYWKRFESLETSVHSYALAAYRVSEMTPSMDPYTFSLLRFASLEDDLTNCKKSCSQLVYSLDQLHNQQGIAITTPPDWFANKTLRIGYLSYDWRDHPMGRLTKALVTSHLPQFHSVSFSYGYDDNSDVREYVRTHSEFVDLAGILSNREAAEMIRDHSIQILVDLTAHTYNNRLEIAALKPSRIVINYLGFPGTTGCPAFDYSIVHKDIVPPELAQRLFSEKLIYLPYTYQANDMPLDLQPCLDSKDCRLMSDHSAKIAQISEDNVLFCSFNSNKKLELLSWNTWMSILRQVPRSKLLLLKESQAHVHLIKQALLNGISRNRLIFLPTLPWRTHLQRAGICDIVLDTFVYGAHTTASDMLWMGVPILALNGYGSERMPSRVAGSLIRSLFRSAAKLAQKNDLSLLLVLDSAKEMEDMAIRLVENVSGLRLLRSIIVHRTLLGETFDKYRLERHIEKAYSAVADIDVIRARSASHIWLSVVDSGQPSGPQRDKQENKLCEGSILCSEYLESIDVCSANITRKPLTLLPCHGKSVTETLRHDELVLIQQCKHLVDSLQRTAIWDIDAKAATVSLVRCLRLNNRNLALVGEILNVVVDMQYALEKVARYDLAFEIGEIMFDSIFVSINITEKSKRVIYRNCNRFADTIMSPMLINSYCYRSKNPNINRNPFQHTPVAQQVIRRLDMQWVVQEWVFGLQCSSDNFDQRRSSALSSDATGGQDCEHEFHHLLRDIAMFGSNILVCLGQHIQSYRNISIASLALASYWLDPSPEKLFSLGKTLEFSGSTDLQQIGHASILHSTLLQHQLRYVPLPDSCQNIVRPDADRLTVAIYCFEYGNEWWPRWGPSSASQGGLGGSEEAVVYLAAELAELGVTVFVYADPILADLHRCFVGQDFRSAETRKVIWLPHRSFDPDIQVDVFIAWRYAASLALSQKATQRFLWLHDLVSAVDISSYWKQAPHLLSGVFVQSKFHVDHMAKQLSISAKLTSAATQSLPPFIVVSNGVTNLSACGNGPHNLNVFVYASSPNRGLEQVLLAWSKIRAHNPLAVLKVFYGFSTSVISQLRQSMGGDFENWYHKMLQLLKQDGVLYEGSVNHQRLTEEFSNAGFILYPTAFPETGCITLIRAMACGVIPITSRLKNSVLPSLTEGFDLGPTQQLLGRQVQEEDHDIHQQQINEMASAIVDGSSYYEKWINFYWLPSVLRAIDNSTFAVVSLDNLRSHMQSAIRQRYTWTRSAQVMLSSFHKAAS